MRAKRVLGLLALLMAIAIVPVSSNARLNREAALRYVTIDFQSASFGFLTVWGTPTESRAAFTDHRIFGGPPCGTLTVLNFVVARNLGKATFDIDTAACGTIHADLVATGPPTAGTYPAIGIQRPADVTGNLPFAISSAAIGLGIPDPLNVGSPV